MLLSIHPDVLKIEDIQHDSVLFRWDGGEKNGSNIEIIGSAMKKRDETGRKVVSDRIESSCQHRGKGVRLRVKWAFEYENITHITHISLIYYSFRVTLNNSLEHRYR